MSVAAYLCECGCGIQVRRRFAQGHWARTQSERPDLRRQHVVEDHGYKTPCWILQGSTVSHGYVQVAYGGRRIQAHILAWEEVNGPVPKGLQLDHLCRQRRCRRPDHLEPVTQTENVRRGAHTKLTPRAVREIRAAVASGETMTAVALRFGIVHQNVSSIVNRLTWKDVA